jgi:hypothetical protein
VRSFCRYSMNAPVWPIRRWPWPLRCSCVRKSEMRTLSGSERTKRPVMAYRGRAQVNPSART